MPRKKKDQPVEEQTELTEDEKSLELLKASLESNFGKGAVFTAQDDKRLCPTDFLHSGAMSINEALGGGYAKGRVIEIYGPESSGKTTLALHAIAEAQKRDERCAFIDLEHALDPNYAEALGINMGELLVSQPNSAEEALNIVLTMAESGAVQLIVLDSVAALVPQMERDKNIGDSSMGKAGGLMSQAMRQLCGPAFKKNCTLLFINQIRMKVGLVFGNPETTPGGNALKFYSSQRIDVRRTGGEKEGKGEDTQLVGNTTKVKVVKNKVAPPFREAEFTIRYGEGIDKTTDLINVAVSRGFIKKAGAWYSDAETEQRLGQGMEKARQFILSNPEYVEELKKKFGV